MLKRLSRRHDVKFDMALHNSSPVCDIHAASDPSCVSWRWTEHHVGVGAIVSGPGWNVNTNKSTEIVQQPVDVEGTGARWEVPDIQFQLCIVSPWRGLVHDCVWWW